jgi:hypothetical protein
MTDSAAVLEKLVVAVLVGKIPEQTTMLSRSVIMKNTEYDVSEKSVSFVFRTVSLRGSRLHRNIHNVLVYNVAAELEGSVETSACDLHLAVSFILN